MVIELVEGQVTPVPVLNTASYDIAHWGVYTHKCGRCQRDHLVVLGEPVGGVDLGTGEQVQIAHSVGVPVGDQDLILLIMHSYPNLRFNGALC